ncbi:MAG TPA: response regulator [Tepidisphaeraceae bacterium]|nr:response regulator [Tepidisphaeraceae bacterium]HYE18922.1 response regulator [Tepidisphaeraceae bacterium]
MKNGLKVLVVDDDVAFRTRLMRAIAARGHEAHGAGTVDEAIEVAARVKPGAAVVDLKMPGGKSGLDLVSDLTVRLPGIQVVVLTGYGSIATAVEAVRKGAINYLMKPLDADQILAAFDTEGSEEGAELETTPSLARVEWEHIQRVLTDCDGNISLAARRLGIHRRSLQRKLGKYPPLE